MTSFFAWPGQIDSHENPPLRVKNVDLSSKICPKMNW